MRRLTAVQLLALGAGLSDRERRLVRDVAQLRLATHAQLASLLDCGDGLASAPSAARQARRVLARLAEAGVLARLDRRVGGIRAGSSGYVYYLGPAGQRLMAYWEGRGLTKGRFRPEPGGRFVRHRLAVTDLYVQARTQERQRRLELQAFDAEPDCWRSYIDGFGGQALLKPDAYIRLARGAYEHSWFVEVDLGTESRNVIGRKLRAYLDYFNTGVEQETLGVFPQVLLLTNTEARRAVLIDICSKLRPDDWHLFAVALLDSAIGVMSGEPNLPSQQRKVV